MLKLWNQDQYNVSRRRLIFIKFKNEEQVKRDRGLPFDEGLLAGCEAYLEETPKPKIKLSAVARSESEHRFIGDDFMGI